MAAEAKETEERCTQLAEDLDGKKTAVLDKARETKQEATEMMRTYLGSDAEGLDGFEFLTMAEAGEVGHWEVLGVLGEKAGVPTSRSSSLGGADPAATPRRGQAGLLKLAGRGRSERDG